MPIKVDVSMNFNDCDLTLESCIEIINVLQNSYKSIRQEMYNHFLNAKHLRNALIVAFISFLGYLATDSLVFIYAMPMIIIVFMAFSILIAEYLTNKTKQQIQIQLKHFMKQKEYLLKKRLDENK